MSIMDSNNKKSRLPSAYDDDLTNEFFHGRIRVGKDYQVPVAPFTPPTESAQSSPDMALQVWCPTDKISDVKLSNFLVAAKEKFGYKEEQSLGMLLWHQHSLKDAITDLANFMPCPDEWTMKDKIIFEQAFQFHGKNFYGIRTMLPEKKIAQLVKYYYMWKKTRNNKSVIDTYKHSKKRMKDSESGDTALDIDEDISDSDLPSGKKWKPGCQQKAPVPSTRHNESQGEGFCSNCHIHCSNCYPTPKGKMCASCQMHFKRTGTLRPTMANDVNTLSVLKLRKNPPKGMYLNHDDLSTLSIDAQANVVLSNLSREVVSCKTTIQLNKQAISALLEQSKLGSIAKYRADPVIKSPSINSVWTSAEVTLAVHGIHKYGKNFKAIAEVMETKTETHIKHFYNKYKNSYQLDTLLAENDPGNYIMEAGEGK